MRYRDIFGLDGKVVVVAGGAGLIGRDVVRALAESGATVALAELDLKKGRRAISELKDSNLDILLYPLDITVERSVLKIIEALHNKYNHIDAWINTAYPKTEDWGRKFESSPSRSWRKNIDMHLAGYFLCCQKIGEYMKRQHSGSIINFASIYGSVGPDFAMYDGTKMTMPAAYSAIKGGIISFTRYLASSYGRYGVRVNSISPGGVYDNQPASFVKRYAAKTPLGRMASPEDIAGGVVYLASDAGRYVTGHDLIIDGGWSAV